MSRPWPIKTPENSIKHDCQKICNWRKRPETILEIRKKALSLQMINNFFEDFTNHKKNINPFHVTGLFRYPWKHQKTCGFLMFSGVSKETSGMKWVNTTSNRSYVMFCAIWYHLYNLKNVKTPMVECYFYPATLLKVTLFHVCFSRFLHCTNDTK